VKHRVGRVRSFYSSRWNWDSPTPSPASECAQRRQSAKLFLHSVELGLPHPLTRRRVGPTPLVPGGVAHSLAGDEVGVQILKMGQTLWYSRYISGSYKEMSLYFPSTGKYKIRFQYPTIDFNIYRNKLLLTEQTKNHRSEANQHPQNLQPLNFTTAPLLLRCEKFQNFYLTYHTFIEAGSSPGHVLG
jgi:hypothetical protein